MGCGTSRGTVVPLPSSSSTSIGSVTSKNEDIRDKYDLGMLLGSGSFGQVREAVLKKPPHEVRAVKMIERGTEDGEWSNQAIFVREVGLLQQIDHDNIIRYFDVYEDHHFLYVVMEVCQGGEVFAKIIEMKRFSERHAAQLGEQMLQAIDYIHKLQIVHRDIKAENFMLAEPGWPATVKMIDFGMACKFNENQVLTELCGSPHYLAPELIGQKYNHLVDVWAFGVLLYLLLYGQYPYDAKHSRDIMVKILTEPIHWQSKVKLSKDAVSFVKQLLEHSPRRRLTAEQALKHQWIISRVYSERQRDEQQQDQHDAEALPTEVVRSAHRKVTATRKQVDPRVDEMRNEKLKRIDEDYSRGIIHGQRLGKTSREEFMTKPEFMRRENKLATAPSQQMRNRRSSMDSSRLTSRRTKSDEELEAALRSSTSANAMAAAAKAAAAGVAAKAAAACTGGAAAAGVAAKAAAAVTGSAGNTSPRSPCSPLQQRRSSRRCQSMSVQRRLSYIGVLSSKEEKNLASLYDEKSTRSTVALPLAQEGPSPKSRVRPLPVQARGFSSLTADGTHSA